MANVFYLKPKKGWSLKPPSGVKPNLGHSQLDGCIALLGLQEGGGTSLHDYYHELSVTSADTWQGPTWSTTTVGVGVDFDGSNDNIEISSPSAKAVAACSSAFTLYIDLFVRGFGQGGFGRILEFNNTVPDDNFRCWYRSASVSNFRIGASPTIGVSNSATQDPDFGVALSTNSVRHQWIFQQSAAFDGSRIFVRENNGPIHNWEITATGDRFVGCPTDADIWILGNSQAGSRAFDGVYHQIRLYDRFINESEVRGIFDNPWAPFERRVWTPVSAGAAPPAWNQTMNEISAPGAVNEITNANIQSVNEI